jgi:hypothetical protein
MCSRREGRRVMEGGEWRARKLCETAPVHSVQPLGFLLVSMFKAFNTSSRWCIRQTKN